MFSLCVGASSRVRRRSSALFVLRHPLAFLWPGCLGGTLSLWARSYRVALRRISCRSWLLRCVASASAACRDLEVGVDAAAPAGAPGAGHSKLRLSFLGDMGTPRRLAGTPGSGADVALGFRTNLLVHRAGRESAGDASTDRSYGGFGVVRVFSLPADSACLPAYLAKPGLPHFSCRSCPSCYGWPSDSSPLRGGKLLLWSGSLNQIRG